MPSGMQEVARATVTIIPNMQGAQQTIAEQLGSASESAGKSGGEKAGSAFTANMGSMISAGAAVVTGAVAAVTGAAIGAGKAIWDSANNVAQFGDNIDKMSQKMGISAQAYQEWDFVMQHSGTSMESLKASMKTLANAAERDNDAFKELGISTKDIQQMSQEDLFSTVIAGLQEVEDTTQRTYLAGQLLGRGATELGALLNMSAEETAAMKQEVHDLGGVLSDTAVKNAATFQDTLQNLTTAADGLKNSMVANLLPSLTTVMNGFTGLITGTDGAEKQISSGINSLIKNITTALPTALDAITSIVSGVASVMPELVVSISDAIISALPQLGNTLLQVGKSAMEALSSVIPQALKAGIELILQLANGITQAIPKLLPSLVSLVLEVGNMIVQNAPRLLEAALLLVKTLAENIASNAVELVTGAIALISQLEVFIIENLPMIIQTAGEIVLALVKGLTSPEAINQMIDAYLLLVDSLVDVVTENIGEIIKTGLIVVAALAKGLLEALPELLMVVPKIYKGLFDKIILMDWKSIGKNIVTGIRDGLIKAKDTLIKAIQNLCTEAWGKVKEFFGIASPSKLMKYAGTMIGEGLVKGIESEENAVDRAMARLNNVTFGSFTPELAFAGDVSGAGSSSIVNTITVNGASDPELWTQGFIRTLNRQERMLHG
ncbi:MAG: hypothetical protein IIZ78_00015 [Clostridiales bacterium]|nr:hypothetical protein [Clostridiales bacterium]